MRQIHTRFTAEQVKALLKGYDEGNLERSAIEEMLEIGRSRFFTLLKEYRQDQDGFSIAYSRLSRSRLSVGLEEEIEKELMVEKGLVDDPTLPITTYNYSAVRDRLKKRDLHVSLPTIIDRAKNLECYRSHPKKKAHDREVVTTTVGALIQHDASHHRWSPYAKEKWVLITSLDDFSRKLLYADFVESETTWAHIRAAENLMRNYGLPFRYYVDSLRVFRFIQSRDGVWRKHVLGTDEADPQWREMMRALGVGVTYALSPQAKGKIERPYRWLQDRIVRTCAIEKLTTIEEGRRVLKEEVDRYNNHQVHSATGQIPSICFEEARRRGNSLFRPLVFPKPYSGKDVFCLREKRTTDGYRRISLYGHRIELPGVPVREEVQIHMVPDLVRRAMEIRIWWESQMKRTIVYPLDEFPSVHF